MKNRLYVGNLSLVAEEHQLEALFGSKGRRVLSVQIPRDTKAGRTKGFAFVEMQTAEEAVEACRELNGKAFLGRALLVSEARTEKATEESEAAETIAKHLRKRGTPL